MILNIKICNISCHSHEFIVVFILCTGYIQTSVTIPYDMKRSQPDTWCSVLYATLPSIMHFARHIWMRSFQIIWNIHVCVCIYIYIYTHTSEQSYTGCGRNNSHIWRGHCSGCGGGTVMGGVSLVSCGLAIFR